MNPKLLGIPTHLYTRPLTQALRAGEVFQLVEDSRPGIARQLREQELSAALLSPLDYAKESSDYCIVPRAAVVSHEGNGSLLVRFREGVRKIKSLAVDPGFAAEIILTKIILAESFDIEPTILPMMASVEAMLQKADAALLAGETAFRQGKASDDIIDVVEEWNDLTGCPYVHALWCGRDGDLTNNDIQHIQQARVSGAAGIDAIARDFPSDERETVQFYLESFAYDLNDDATAGLGEFMKYLYYHGVLPDVAELNFFKTDEGTSDDLHTDLSSN